jgi:hypothetical protein
MSDLEPDMPFLRRKHIKLIKLTRYPNLHHPCILGFKSGIQSSGLSLSIFEQNLSNMAAPLAAAKTGSMLENTGCFSGPSLH